MKKRAILFGMFHYNRSASITANDLPSTEIDVKTLEKRLKQLQFETVSYMDLCLKDMEQKITEFADTAPCDSLNVVYFSGHGGHSKGENYLYPVDFGNSLDARMSIEDSAFNLKRIQPLFKRKVKLLIIVDACRDKLKPDYACNYSEMVAPQDTYISGNRRYGCTGYVLCILSRSWKIPLSLMIVRGGSTPCCRPLTTHQQGQAGLSTAGAARSS